MEGEKKLMAANYTIYQQNQKIEADKPKVELAEHVEVSDCSMIVEDVAKCLYDKHKIEMGKNRLMD
jgi:phage antirepressor YoqD-like protein